VVLAMATASPASGGTFAGKLRHDQGAPQGVMTYRASPGVANRVTVGPYVEGDSVSSIVVRDRSEPVRARGDCIRVDRHSATCPWTESSPPVVVLTGDRADRVEIRQACRKGRFACDHFAGRVRGGRGDDVLTGGGELYGGRGDDLLRGTGAGDGWDRIHGGPGRDRMEGRGRNSPLWPDLFYDDETDAQAARDVVVAGRKARAWIDYSLRKRSMRIDLHGDRIGPERDLVSDVKSVTSGAGNDVLIGTGGPNDLHGGPGADRLYGRLGDDRLAGARGDDAMYGGDGDDVLTEVHFGRADGEDTFVGGAGVDELHSLDALRRAATAADEVRCDGFDKPVESDPLDRLYECTEIVGWSITALQLRVRPEVGPDGATYTLRCGGPTEIEQRTDPETGYSTPVFRCRGRLTLRGPNGDELGTQTFALDGDVFGTPWVTVTVPLTDAGRDAILTGQVIQLDAEAQSANGWSFPPAGYRTVLTG
jgi:hypothetical protein